MSEQTTEFAFNELLEKTPRKDFIEMPKKMHYDLCLLSNCIS